MSLNIEVQKRQEKVKELRQVKVANDIYNLEEVQEITNALQEHIFYIGLDRANHVRHINLVGLGNSAFIGVDAKQLVRIAIVNADEKVIFVHNHPSNSLKASEHDITFTNKLNSIFKVFNIEVLDHIIVTESGYLSMASQELLDKDYKDKKIDSINKILLYEENSKLKLENDKLKEKLKNINIKEKVEELEDEEIL